MANSTIKSPIIVDTAGAGLVITRTLDIHYIRWVGQSAAATAIVQDADGRVQWEAVAVDTDSKESVVSWTAEGGFKVPTLGSGRLYFYYRVPRVKK